jgi:hypothetical protein
VERAAALIEETLPQASFVAGPLLGEDHPDELDDAPMFGWIPAGRPTRLPPDAAGERIFIVEVYFGPYLDGGEAIVTVDYDAPDRQRRVGDLYEDWPEYQYRFPPEVVDQLFSILRAAARAVGPSHSCPPVGSSSTAGT